MFVFYRPLSFLFLGSFRTTATNYGCLDLEQEAEGEKGCCS